MNLLRLAKNSAETAGHGIAAGATTLADEVTGRQIPQLGAARRESSRGFRAAAQRAGENTRSIADNVNRVVGTTGVSAVVFARIITSPDQLKRLFELIETHDFPGLVSALQHGADFPPDFFPQWIRRAGGYFPKFAQVLAVRGDLIHSREVLDQFGRCLEDMPPRPVEAVRDHLRQQGWNDAVCAGVGESLNAGTVAQVNTLNMPDGSVAVVKVAWPDTKRQMQTDFRLFSHARDILGALRLEDEQATAVAGLFSAVGKNEPAVMREFDMPAEFRALRTAGVLCRDEWSDAYRFWLGEADSALAGVPPHMAVLARLFFQQTPAWSVRVPEPLDGYCCESALTMSCAAGESLHRLLSGHPQEAAKVMIGLAVPFIGWLLLCKSCSHLAHVDPHPGNFRWDAGLSTLWVLDWGSNVTLSDECRAALCLLISLIAESADDGPIADTARAVGIQVTSEARLAQLMRGMLNASHRESAQDAIGLAAIDHILDHVGDDIVPVVRCLATIGGILKHLQQQIRDAHSEDVPLSLASLWKPFAVMGLRS